MFVVRGYIKAPILGVKLINTWLFQLNALGAFSLTNLVFSSITCNLLKFARAFIPGYP